MSFLTKMNKRFKPLQDDFTVDDMHRALQFAAIKHKDQFRGNKAKDPYIVHPIGVARIALAAGYCNGIAIACYLHDTLEDTQTTEKELEDTFGPLIARMVKEVTDDKTLLKEDRKRLQIEHAPHLSSDAKIIKLCDKIYNLRDLLEGKNGSGIKEDWSVERVQRYVAWANKVYLAGLTDVDEDLDAIFQKLLTKQFQYFDGTLHPALPDGWEDLPLV